MLIGPCAGLTLKDPSHDPRAGPQQARNLLMDLGGQAERTKFMIRDRGSNLTDIFDAVLADAGIRTVRATCGRLA